MKKTVLCLLAAVCMYPLSTRAELPLSSTHEKWMGYRLERLTLTAADGDKIPFVMVKPKKCRKAPAVLVLHGISGSKEDILQPGNFAHGGDLTLKLVKAGYTVAALDLRMHGERGEEYPDFTAYYNAVIANWGVVYPMSLSDILVCTDYLHNRLNTDTIALVGYSMGGMFTFNLAKNHADKYATAVACVTPTLTGTNMPGSPELYAEGIDSIPFHMLIGTQDENYVLSDAINVFSAITVQQKKLSVYDSGHGLPEAYTDDVVEWIQRFCTIRKKAPRTSVK